MSQPTSHKDYDEIEYPSSDGEPLAETDAHVEELLALRQALSWRYHDDPNVYVAGNNFIYYEENNPKKVFSPDVYVVKGVPKKRRRVFRLWEEGRAPCFVFEMSSCKTWLEDIGNKKALCAFLGVREYFLYDPEGDVVKPPLQGFRLAGAEYHRIPARRDGAVESKELEVIFWLDDELRLHATDVETGKAVLRPHEVYQAHEEAEHALAEAEREIARLRAELKR
jgi:Uma2 family endonuclease